MEVTHRDRRVYLAFAALALLAGPIDQFAGPWFLLGSPLPVFQSLTILCVLAAFVLALFAAVRGRRVPTRAEWGALCILIVPQWCAVPFGSRVPPLRLLHGLGWGAELLLGLAAPLWLGLAGAAGLVRVEVPHAVIAAAIVGMGAMCLVLPEDALAVAWNQLPALALNVLLGVAIAVSWVLARDRLKRCPVTSAAAGYTALSALGYLVFAAIYGRGSLSRWEWHGLALPLLVETAAWAASWWLWFWLLRNLTLGAFGMRMLASSAAGLLPGFAAFGFLEWRMDAAVLIAIAAIVVALRASPRGEQPIALGLASPGRYT